MTALRKALFGTALGTAALAFSAVTASAAIVCTGVVCWHAKERYTYPPTSHVIIHEDSWKWGPSEHFTWREHEGRGYWAGETWTEF